MSIQRFSALLAGVLAAALGCGHGQDLPAATQSKLDAMIGKIVAQTGVPSASVGIVEGGRVVYTQAFGDARLKPEQKATAAMSYPIGSISKQFTAACILALAADGKLKLDDPVSRWFPELTRASDVTVRMLLSHTSGYEDYAPQDYTIPAWTKPVDPLQVVREWAGKKLDFEPGTQWQYSNTNFVLAALIVQKASGMPYFEFLRQRVLAPAGLTGVLDLDTDRARVQPQGYERRALAAPRPAVLEAPGWYFGDASLAMPVAQLLRWDIYVMSLRSSNPAEFQAFATPTKLKDGTPTRYSLGMSVGSASGRLALEHSGEVGGFVAENIVFPDDGMAVAVLTNQEASSAASQIARAVAREILPRPAAPETPRMIAPTEQQVRTILGGLQEGRIDRGLFTDDANYYFSAETLGDYSSSLKPLGTVTSVARAGQSLRGGMTECSFDVGFAGGKHATVSTYTLPDGQLEQFLVEGRE